MSDKNENPDAGSSNEAIVRSQKKENDIIAIKAIEELQKEQRESEQLGVNPEQVLEEEEKRQPQP
ncbi:MAG: hypothetical protein WBY71_00410 [Nitrososphaeraceae archaeon]